MIGQRRLLLHGCCPRMPRPSFRNVSKTSLINVVIYIVAQLLSWTYIDIFLHVNGLKTILHLTRQKLRVLHQWIFQAFKIKKRQQITGGAGVRRPTQHLHVQWLTYHALFAMTACGAIKHWNSNMNCNMELNNYYSFIINICAS